jgi:hypothetical protein
VSGAGPRVVAGGGGVTVSDADLGWLAGVIDSEGTVSLVRSQNRNPILRISIYNSSDLILDRVARILAALDVTWTEHVDARHERTAYGFHFSTKHALRIYPILRPHMVRQVNRYDAAYWFLAPRYEGRQRVMWTDRERGIWQNLRGVLNAR